MRIHAHIENHRRASSSSLLPLGQHPSATGEQLHPVSALLHGEEQDTIRSVVVAIDTLYCMFCASCMFCTPMPLNNCAHHSSYFSLSKQTYPLLSLPTLVHFSLSLTLVSKELGRNLTVNLHGIEIFRVVSNVP